MAPISYLISPISRLLSKWLMLFCLPLMGLMVQSCEPEADLVRHFIIRKGEHYATHRVVESLQTEALVFRARFDESAKYNFKEEGFQDSKNKLLGFSDCNSLHHENSARFAWQWFNDQLEIYAYCYVNGARVEQYVGTVNMGDFNRYEIRLSYDKYLFRLNDEQSVEISRGNNCNIGLYYMLWPYFGGSLPAPHDVRIDIKMLY
jgi:hypothetical protein